jgi:peptide/nickel transport system substrate-binding protein
LIVTRRLALALGTLAAAAALANEAHAATFRYSLDLDIDYVDPALAYYQPSWEILYATCSMLVSYPDAPAPRGARLVPDGAAAMPTISRDGKTYTFRIRRGLRFSTGERITARNYVYALNRMMSQRMSSPGREFFRDVVGARGVLDGNLRTVSGLRALDDYRLRIRLRKRAPDLLARLAMPFACPLPVSTPMNPDGIRAPVPGSGPYYVARWEYRREIWLRRNRYYRGPRPHKIDDIVYDVGLPPATIKLKIDQGSTDHGPVPPQANAELGATHGVRRRSPGRYFVNPTGSIRYLAMNHDRDLFGPKGSGLGNVRLKQAVNFAIDRTALVGQFGAYAGVFNDQYLPPTMPGFRNAALYPTRPELARARALASGSRRSGKVVLYACPGRPCEQLAQIVQQNLRAIDLDVDVRFVCRACWWGGHRTRGEPFDLILESWRMDYFDPYDFLFLVDGRTIKPYGNTNLAYFDSRRYNRRIAAASSLSGQARYRAFGALDVDLARNAAPLAPYMTDNARRYFSARVRNFFEHPVYGLDLPAIAVQ